MTAYRTEDIPLLLDAPEIGQGRAIEAGGMMLQREHFKAGADAGGSHGCWLCAWCASYRWRVRMVVRAGRPALPGCSDLDGPATR